MIGGPTSSGGPEPVSIWAWGYNGNISNWSADPILQAIEKATNTKISISFFAVDTFTNKVNAAIASGQPTDIIGAVSNQSLVAKWAHDGAIAPFEGDVAAAAPHIVDAYKTNKSLSELEIDGKIYVNPVQWDNGTYPNMGIVHVRMACSRQILSINILNLCGPVRKMGQRASSLGRNHRRWPSSMSF